MLVNPLFAKDEDDNKHAQKPGQSYVFHNHKGKTIQPVSKDLKAAAPHTGMVDNTQHHYPRATAGSASGMSGPRAAASKLQAVYPTAKAQQEHPDSPKKHKTQDEAAVELIRRKVAAVYGDEPEAEKELEEVVQHSVAQPSRYQQFMASLSSSGKSLAQIQTEWHNYYVHHKGCGRSRASCRWCRTASYGRSRRAKNAQLGGKPSRQAKA
jgi:hypothetical protein